MEADLLDAPQRVDSAGEAVLGSVRKLLGRLAIGALRPTPEQLAVAADPEYQGWLVEVDAARAAAEERLTAAGSVCRTEEMEPEAPSVLRRFLDLIYPLERRLGFAAEGAGLRGRLARRLAVSRSPRWVAVTGTKGLYLVADAEGVKAAWVGKRGKPPRVQRTDPTQTQPAKWNQVGDISLSEAWPWAGGRVVLRIGPRQGRKVVIRQ
jgi:hypothetical protein